MCRPAPAARNASGRVAAGQLHAVDDVDAAPAALVAQPAAGVAAEAVRLHARPPALHRLVLGVVHVA